MKALQPGIVNIGKLTRKAKNGSNRRLVRLAYSFMVGAVTGQFVITGSGRALCEGDYSRPPNGRANWATLPAAAAGPLLQTPKEREN